MLKLWLFAIWLGVNIASMLAIFDLANSPSTVAVVAAVLGLLVLVTFDVVILRELTEHLTEVETETKGE